MSWLKTRGVRGTPSGLFATPAGVLPPSAAKMLRDAVIQQEPDVLFGESKARTKALDQATARVKQLYPYLFVQE